MSPRALPPHQPENHHSSTSDRAPQTDRPLSEVAPSNLFASVLPAWDLVPDQGILVRRRRSEH